MRGLALLPILFLCGCAAAIAAPAQPVPSRINGRGVAIAAMGFALAEGKSTPKPAQASPVPRVEAPVSDPEFPPATPHHPAPVDDGWDVPKPPQPEPDPDFNLDHFTPPDPVPVPRSLICFTDPMRCAPCARQDQQFATLRAQGWSILQKPGGNIHVVNQREWPQAFRQWNIQGLPTFVLVEGDREIRRFEGYLSADQIRGMLQPAQAWGRPREAWRAALPRNAPAAIHTQLSLGSIDLPTTRINLLGQAIEFVDSRESQLNEWFSIAFRAGTVKHEGSSVVFSAPPQVNLLMPFGHKLELAALKSIEFVPGGADLHTDRMTIPFRVK